MSRPPDFEPDQLIGEYVLLDLLGAGQDGEVWRARKKSLGTICAAKFLNALDQDKLDRFDREIRILAHIRSPHIIAIYDRGTAWNPRTKQHVPFYIMEYIEESAPIDEAFSGVPEQRLFRTILALFEQITRALAFVHTFGITHGDLKPANVLVLKRDRLAKITDFGFGALPGEESAHRADYPTSSYRTPAGLDARAADIYKLGLTFADVLESVSDRLRPEETVAVRASLERLLRVPPTIDLEAAAAQFESLSELSGDPPRGPSTPELHPTTGFIMVRVAARGDIALSERARRLIDQPLLQRLRYFPEQPLEQLAFPAATSTLFQDGLEAFGMTTQYLRHFSESPPFRDLEVARDVDCLLLGALLSAVGEYPFSEVVRAVFVAPEFDPRRRAIALVGDDQQLDALSSDWLISPSDALKQLIEPGRTLRALVHSSLAPAAVARLWRRAVFAGGVALPKLDEIIDALEITENGNSFVIRSRFLSSVEALFVARSTIYERVHHHMSVRSARAMLAHGLRELRDIGVAVDFVFESEQRGFLDRCADVAIKHDRAELALLFRAITQRSLYRRVALVEGAGTVECTEQTLPLIAAHIDMTLRGAISVHTGADAIPSMVVWDVFDRLDPARDVMVSSSSGELAPIEEVSPIVRSLLARPRNIAFFAPTELLAVTGKPEELQALTEEAIREASAQSPDKSDPV
jgi:serine/threonine protein kinase